MKLDIHPDNARLFRVGQPITLTAEMVRASLWFRVRLALRRWTRWWRPRTVVTEVDTERGVVTAGKERWSWRRWRWERS